MRLTIQAILPIITVSKSIEWFKKKILIKPFFLIILFNQCTIPIDSDSFDYERTLVVDGQITNVIDYHQIAIKYSKPITAEVEEPIDDAIVWLETNDGELIDFTYSNSFEAYIPNTPFGCEEGKSYQLIFELSTGESYHSNMIAYISTPDIDSLYYRNAEVAPQGSTSNEGGIQFFVDSYEERTNAQYFRYEWMEDFKIITPRVAVDLYLYPEDVIVEKTEPTNICYGHKESKNIILGNNLSTDGKMVEFPIRFVSAETDVLRNRYTIEVTQYSIDMDTYNFYKKFKQLNESTGSLFDYQAGTIAGNIVSENDPYEVVLGYFEVAGITKKRIFVSYRDIPPPFIRPKYRATCLETDIIPASLYFSLGLPQLSSWGQNLDIIEYTGSTPMIGDQHCSNCTFFGDIEPPAYWEE